MSLAVDSPVPPPRHVDSPDTQYCTRWIHWPRKVGPCDGNAGFLFLAANRRFAEPAMADEQSERRRLLRIVMFAVLAWGSVLALGAALYGVDPATGGVQYSPNILRGFIVEGCVLGFLGIWLLAIFRRRG